MGVTKVDTRGFSSFGVLGLRFRVYGLGNM